MWQVEGAIWMFKYMGQTAVCPNYFVKLFKTSLLGTGRNRIHDEAKVSSFPGYAYQMLTWASPPVADSLDHVSATTPTLTWERSAGEGSEQIVGIGILTLSFPDGNWKLCWYKDLDLAVTIDTPGQQFKRIIKLWEDNYEHPVHA